MNLRLAREDSVNSVVLPLSPPARQAAHARALRAETLLSLQRKNQLLDRYPVTVLVSLQYGILVLVPALLKGTQPLATLAAICAVAACSALYVEGLSSLAKRHPRQSRPVSELAALTVLSIGVFASIAAVALGANTYATQIGQREASPLASLFTPFEYWALFGVALYVWLHRQGQVTRQRALLVIGVTCAVQLVLGVVTAVIAQEAAFVLAALVLAIWSRLLRPRTVLFLVLLVPLVWPTIYDLRNERRGEAFVGSGFQDRAGDRLQLDEQMATAGYLSERRAVFEPPSLGTLLRIGLVPRALDPGRPPLDTGARLNVALGGQPTSSHSALMLGNAFVFGSWWLVALLSGLLAIAMGVALRAAGPWALASASMLFLYGVSLSATYPDMIPRLLQGAQSMVAAYILVRLLDRKTG